MKKTLTFLSIIVLLFGLTLFTYSISDPNGGPDTSFYGNEGSDSGATEYYYVERSICPNDKTKTEYKCKAGGSYKCTVQNCP